MDAYITYEPFSCLFTACVGNTKKVLFIYVVKVKCFVCLSSTQTFPALQVYNCPEK